MQVKVTFIQTSVLPHFNIYLQFYEGVNKASSLLMVANLMLIKGTLILCVPMVIIVIL